MYYRFAIARREALPVRSGHRVRLPSGRCAVIEDLARHHVALRYIDSGATVELTRAVLAQWLRDTPFNTQ